MLNCVQTMIKLSRYLDRELTDDEIVEVKRHLAACPPCGRHLRFEEDVRRLVRMKATGDCAPARLRSLIVEAWQRTSGERPATSG